jgi:LPS-assembly protein
MIGAGYYWAINPSYDAAYRAQFFTQGALAHNFDFRGKPNESSDFNVALFGVQDPGTQTGNTTTKEGGFTLTAQGRSDLGDGFYARGELNYLSSLLFRQSFTQSYSEAISSEVHSIGFITKQWSTYGLDLVAQRSQDYLSTTPGDNIAIRKLPEVEFTSRDRRIADNFPVWVSWQMSGGLMERTEPDLQTRSSVGRLEIYPEITTVLRWKDFALVPSFAVRETYYDESLNNQFHIAGQNVATGGREVNLQFVLPSFARVYDGPKWLGDKIKHVIEPGADYHYVTGVNNFNNVLRFDEMDVFSNTNEVEVWVTNRLYAKRKDKVEEILSWDLRQKRYFDPTFGGAVSNWCGQTACRNIVLSEMELTPYAFLDGPRNYSPIVSTLRMSPKPGFGIEWRSDYDPLRHNFVASSATIDIHHGIYGFSFGQNSLKAVPALIPNSNQLRGQFTIGNDNRRGWNAGFQAVYDYRLQQLQFANTQVTYNTDCCGFTFGFRRLSYGIRNENQFQVSFSVANVGAFGTLKKQDRMF